jgi:hypothetical protein
VAAPPSPRASLERERASPQREPHLRAALALRSKGSQERSSPPLSAGDSATDRQRHRLQQTEAALRGCRLQPADCNRQSLPGLSKRPGSLLQTLRSLLHTLPEALLYAGACSASRSLLPPSPTVTN